MTYYPLAETGAERAWLCHEIGRWYLGVEMYTEAVEWGDRTLLEGQADQDPDWQIYGLVLMAQARGGTFIRGFKTS